MGRMPKSKSAIRNGGLNRAKPFADDLAEAKADYVEDLPSSRLPKTGMSLAEVLSKAKTDYNKDLSNESIEERTFPIYSNYMSILEDNINSLSDILHIPSSARAQFRAAIFRAADNLAVPPDDEGCDEEADIGKGAAESQTIQAMMPDETLVRLTLRYEQLLQDINLPDDGLFKTKEQARAAARIASTYQNLRKRQIARGLEPLPKDSRVTEAERLREAFYRKARQNEPS